jgi:hypothetical protein
MKKLSIYEKILSVMSKWSHMTSEEITEQVYMEFGNYWKASNTERRLRELLSKQYKNEYNSSIHKRWIIAQKNQEQTK